MAGVKRRRGFCVDFVGKAVVEPSIGRRKLDARNAVICYTSDFYRRLVKAFGAAKSKDAPMFDGAVSGKIVKGTALYQSSVGAPAAAMMLEEAIASGVRRILMLGLAGSVSPSVRIGDMVVPTWGLREEGTSHHYFSASHRARPSRQLTARLERVIEADQFFEGGVWSIDSAFRETRAKVARYAKMGVLAIDMETTALMCVAEYRDVEFAALLVISDELFGKTWNPAFGSPKVNRAVDAACESAVRFFSTRRGA